MVTEAPQQMYLAQARDSLNADDCMKIYDKWAASYNAEVGDAAQNYVAPVLVAQVALKSTTTPKESVILDAGCGTGLVGQALAMEGAKIIDGMDLSVPMLDIARQAGVYRKLEKCDLTKRIQASDETYDIITCVGTFTRGHVGPDPALREFVRITKKNGVIVATILEEIWVAGGFKAEVEKMRADGLVNVVAQELVDYVKGHGDKAILLVLERQI
jgi:2-polyprenyl-3-methyl-5-hydroxy-6-metoxy-1,4-benzoquinol methylase